MRVAFTFQSWYLPFAKPLVSGRETMGFRLWNPWFYNMKPMLSECNFMGFRNCSHAPQKMNIYAVLGGRGVVKWKAKNSCDVRGKL